MHTRCGIGVWADYGNLLVHEFCHDDSDQGTHVHSPEFYEKFHDWTSAVLGKFTAGCLNDLPRYQTRVLIRANKKALRTQDMTVKAQRAALAVQEHADKLSAKTSPT